MGNDAALPVLSNRPKVFYNYFKQLFAQVTNPPIDPIREELVMSLVSFIGPRPNLLAVNPDATAPSRRCASKCSSRSSHAENMEKLRHASCSPAARSSSIELDICYPAAWGANGMEAALASLAAHAEDAIRQGYNILILSDRSVSRRNCCRSPRCWRPRAVHEHLVKQGLRTRTGLVVETGSAREVHHFALLAGYGAEAIHPYLALETLARLHEQIAEHRAEGIAEALHQGDLQGPVQGDVQDGHLDLPVATAARRSSRRSGSQKAFVDKYFTGTASNIEGIGLFEVAEEAERLHRLAFGDDPLLAQRARCRRRVRVPRSAAKSTCGRRIRSRSCSTRRARTAIRPTRSTRR